MTEAKKDIEAFTKICKILEAVKPEDRERIVAAIATFFGLC